MSKENRPPAPPPTAQIAPIVQVLGIDDAEQVAAVRLSGEQPPEGVRQTLQQVGVEQCVLRAGLDAHVEDVQVDEVVEEVRAE